MSLMFFYGDLQEEVHMISLLGLCLNHSQQVCKFQKSLYHLKHANIERNCKFTSTLIF